MTSADSCPCVSPSDTAPLTTQCSCVTCITLPVGMELSTTRLYNLVFRVVNQQSKRASLSSILVFYTLQRRSLQGLDDSDEIDPDFFSIVLVSVKRSLAATEFLTSPSKSR